MWTVSHSQSLSSSTTCDSSIPWEKSDSSSIISSVTIGMAAGGSLPAGVTIRPLAEGELDIWIDLLASVFKPFGALKLQTHTRQQVGLHCSVYGAVHMTCIILCRTCHGACVCCVPLTSTVAHARPPSAFAGHGHLSRLSAAS